MYKYKPVIAEPHTPPYKIHKYFARRPWNVFEQLVCEFAKENEIVLDPFCGGGVTIYEGIKNNRKVIGFDLNPLSIFIVENMIKGYDDIAKIKDIYNSLNKYLMSLYENLKEFQIGEKDLFGERNSLELWNELTFIVSCPVCGKSTQLLNSQKVKNGFYKCQNDNCPSHNSNVNYFQANKAKRIGRKYLLTVYKESSKKKVVPFDIHREKAFQKHVQWLKKQVSDAGITIPQEIIPMNWDRQFEDTLSKKGILYFKDFFTERNLYINLLLKERIDSELSETERDIFRLIFSSSLKDTNIMSFTVDSWQGGNPTSWSKHAYWIPNQFCETSIIEAFKNAFQRMVASIEFNNSHKVNGRKVNTFDELKGESNVLLYNTSISNEIPDCVIDAIITDPPYGSNVQYLELSHFWHIWNYDLYKNSNPEFSKEAIFNRKKNFDGYKDIKQYETNLESVFKECYRVLKNERFMTLTFNNKDIGAWLAILIAIFKSGFELAENGIYFQDGVKNYRQTSHTKSKGSPFGDFIYVFVKNTKQLKTKEITQSEFVDRFHKLFEEYENIEIEGTEELNQNLIRLFNNLVPLVSQLVKTFDKHKEDHSLYEILNKKYIDKLYDKKN